MAKKKNKMNWKRNLPLSKDTSFINTWHYFVPDDFEYFVPTWLERYVDKDKVAKLGWDPPLAFKECVCRLMNFWRNEYATLQNNGQPKSSYKPDVADRINRKKKPRLARKFHACVTLMAVMGMRLKPEFNRLDKNNEPRFAYEYTENAKTSQDSGDELVRLPNIRLPR